jgi:hypothetical protein
MIFAGRDGYFGTSVLEENPLNRAIIVQVHPSIPGVSASMWRCAAKVLMPIGGFSV